MISIDSTTAQVFGLVLAAGRSRRFAGDKRRALLPCGRSMLRASLDNAHTSFRQIWVVLREDDDPRMLDIPPEVNIIRCADAHLGMGHSLACGIEALPPSPACAVAILLADMPWIEPQTLHCLAEMADPERIALPRYTGRRGHPVVIGRRFWPALRQLEGDQGAKTLIAANLERCDFLDCDDAGVLCDADTPQALESACQQRYGG